MSPAYEDALGAYLDPEEPEIAPTPATPAPITDPVERHERLTEWADDADDDRGENT